MPNEMRDIRLCVNCNLIGQLTKQGRCSFCDSDAVCLPQQQATFQAMRDRDLWELEKMFLDRK